MKNLLFQTKSYIVALLTVLVIVTWVLVLGSRPVSSDTSPVRVVIERGASAGRIARILGDSGLIRSPFVFSLTCRMSAAGSKLKPGVYELRRTMNVPEIIRVLVRGDSLESWVTVPEGFTARQIADVLDEKQLADGEAYVRVSITQGYDFPSYPFIDGNCLEGYLFPDTYLIARGTDPDGIISKMLEAFQKKVVDAHRAEIVATIKARFGLGESEFAEGLQRILTMASLVEREAKVPADRPRIAAVLWNRLDKKMKLQVDASVSYRPGESRENKDHVFYHDLESDSPFNTYKHYGLPPSPICNPGLAAILAVLHPASGDWLYYVAKDDGSHVFSRTLQEHEGAKKAGKSGGAR